MSVKTFTHLCEDSGVTLTCRHVSYTLADELVKLYPPPLAPEVPTQVGDRVEMVRNEAHPEHVVAMRNYQRELNMRMNQLVVLRGVVLDALTPEQLSEVKQLREDMAQLGVNLNPDDKYVFIFQLAAVTPEDYQDLLAAITRRSVVTAEGKAAAIARFRPT